MAAKEKLKTQVADAYCLLLIGKSSIRNTKKHSREKIDFHKKPQTMSCVRLLPFLSFENKLKSGKGIKQNLKS